VKIGKNRVVAIDYAIRTVDGALVESSGSEPLRYLHGRSQLLPGVERAIDGGEAGREYQIELAAREGYGERDPAGVFLVPREAFPGDEPINIGMVYSAMRPDGMPVTFRVLRVTDELVLVDTNHPLAGRALRVWVAVRAVRDATALELLHGAVAPEAPDAPLPC
jgi:FKBP-type peptidyl-prolyl cis-trans isomerase SlyD